MFKLTNPAFKTIDKERLTIGLNNIKLRREKSLKLPDHKEEIRHYKKEIADLGKAVDKLDLALQNISIVVGANMSAGFPEDESPIELLREGVEQYKLNGNIPVREIGDKSNETLLRQRFVCDVARLYKSLTGKEATITINPMDNNKKGGEFIEFLLACSDVLEVNPRGLIKRAQDLRERGVI